MFIHLNEYLIGQPSFCYILGREFGENYKQPNISLIQFNYKHIKQNFIEI